MTQVDRSTARRLAGVAAFCFPLALYAATLAPSVTLEDSGEFITAAYHLGVPHPPGYPLWCLLAHAFTWLPWGTVAERVHLSSAFFAATAAFVVYLVALRLFADWRPALVAALSLAVSRRMWSQSVIAEVYTLNVLLSVLLVYVALRWRESRSPQALYALALAVGVGLTNHYMIALVALPLFGWLVASDARAVLRPRVLVTGAACLVLGLSVYLYLPLRAAAAPPLNVGNATTLSAVVAHVRRDVYFKPNETGRTAGTLDDVTQHTFDALLDAGRSFGWPLSLVALLGIASWPRGSRDVLAATLAIAVCNTLLLNALLTAPHSVLWVYVHRVYYLPLHAMIALWIGAGVLQLVTWAGRRGVVARWAISGALAVALVVAAWRSYPEAHQQGNHVAHDLALDLLDSAPQGAGFLPVGDDVLYPVLYARQVEGLRPDVHLLSRQYGWRGEPYSALLSADPPSEQLRDDMPALRDYVAVPHGLVYALVPRDAAGGRADHAAFVPLPRPPRDGGLADAAPDLFVDAVRARYATYRTRLGALLLSRGDVAAGLAELDAATRLDPGDAHVKVLLFDVYRDLGVRKERLRPLLESALRDFDRMSDPHSDRYDALRRQDIEQRLRSLPPAADDVAASRPDPGRP